MFGSESFRRRPRIIQNIDKARIPWIHLTFPVQLMLWFGSLLLWFGSLLLLFGLLVVLLLLFIGLLILSPNTFFIFESSENHPTNFQNKPLCKQKTIHQKHLHDFNSKLVLNINSTASADLEVQLVQLNHCDGVYSNY